MRPKPYAVPASQVTVMIVPAIQELPMPFVQALPQLSPLVGHFHGTPLVGCATGR